MAQAPYNGAMYEDQMIEYMYKLGQNAEGKQIGMPVDPAPAGLFYRKDVLDEYLGTSDSDELKTMLSDWDAMLEAAVKIKDNSKW